MFDASVGVLLLQTGLLDLTRLSKLPEGLEAIGLPLASMALIFALGHNESVWDEIERDPEERERFFSLLATQPVADDLPDSPVLWIGQRVSLNSTIFGCEYVVDSVNTPSCVAVAESILAAAEALVGSLKINEAFGAMPKISIRVRSSDFAPHPFSFDIKHEGGRPAFEISVAPFDPNVLELQEQLSLRSKLYEVVTALLVHTTRFDDFEHTFTRLLETEEAQDRAFSFTGSAMTIGNVLGHEPPYRLSLYEAGKSYELLRTAKWVASDGLIYQRDDRSPLSTPEEQHLPIAETLSTGKLKHSQMRMVSPIRERLWEQAGWLGVGYMIDQLGERPPIIALMFKDDKAGREIFEYLLSDYGRVDDHAALRVAFVKGIDRENPTHYRVSFGANPDSVMGGETRFTHLACRICTMEPDNSANLDMFAEHLALHGRAIFAPAKSDGRVMLGIDAQVGLLISNIAIRDAWEIGRHDTDAVALLGDTLPVIPEGIEDPPVEELLAWRRSKTNEKASVRSRRTEGKNPRNQPCPCGSGKKFKRCHGRPS